ncbi:hypothetical protein EVAR_74841_1 [Eumeta japonica]|uniref:Uncharacterized protein n=1 Tax=Eumeta variegata TaxID=151549 RepID=A0A4C1SQ38_EUMVA|nr:hypothetical protein EVAR_74841_1 [Eumeta japonica]
MQHQWRTHACCEEGKSSAPDRDGTAPTVSLANNSCATARSPLPPRPPSIRRLCIQRRGLSKAVSCFWARRHDIRIGGKLVGGAGTLRNSLPSFDTPNFASPSPPEIPEREGPLRARS